jgi:ABC-type nickel/cobalt efflux system permease component RcnA
VVVSGIELREELKPHAHTHTHTHTSTHTHAHTHQEKKSRSEEISRLVFTVKGRVSE